jgi:hypothetical protein
MAILIAVALLGVGCGDDGITFPELKLGGADESRPEQSATPKAAADPPPAPPAGAIDLGTVDLEQTLPNQQPYSSRAFQAFDLAEMRVLTGRRLRAHDMVPTASGGEITVEAAIEEINQLEELLNAKGMSLRDDRHTIRRVAVAPDATQLNSQRDAIIASYQEVSGIPPGVERFTDRQLTEVATSAPPGGGFEERQRQQAYRDGYEPDTYSIHEPWEISYGNERFVAAWMRASFDLEGDLYGFHAAASASAGATAFNREIRIVEASASFDAPRGGNPDIDFNLMVAGQSISLSPVEFGQAAWDENTRSARTRKYERTVDYSVTASWPVLGIIKVVAEVGASGSAGFETAAITNDLMAGFDLFADADVSLYAEAGAAVDLGFRICGVRISIAELSGGIGADLTIIEDHLHAGGRVSLDFELSYSASRIEYTYSCINSLSLLSGSLYAWAEADFPRPFNWADKRWEEELYSWDGPEVEGEIFGDSGSIPMYSL